MTEVRVGRLLPACLHQAISDELPDRLEFYENWLHPEGLRDGSIGLAPVTGVLGFLRTEGPAYDRVMARAGELAADWTIASLSSMQRQWVGWLPWRFRARAALRLAASIVHDVSRASRASSKVRGNQARVEVESSLFCAVRDTPTAALCGFYLAVAVVVLRHFEVFAAGRLEHCRARGDARCVINLDLSITATDTNPAMAA